MLHYQEHIPEHFKSDYEALEQVRLKKHNSISSNEKVLHESKSKGA